MIQEQTIFGVAGGDRRQAELIGSLAADGYTVYALVLKRPGWMPVPRRFPLQSWQKKARW